MKKAMTTVWLYSQLTDTSVRKMLSSSILPKKRSLAIWKIIKPSTSIIELHSPKIFNPFDRFAKKVRATRPFWLS